MRAAPTPTQPPPPPVRTHTRAIEPDEQWKAELRKRIEDGLRGMVEDAQTVRDTILNSHPSESSRELVLSNYEESMNDIRTLAQDEFTRQLRIEMSERKRALDVADFDPPDVSRQQQWVLDSIRKTDEDPTTSAPSDAPHSPPQQGDSEHGFDESPEDGYGSAGLGDESGESRETSEEGDEDEEEGEDWGEENAAPRQLRPPSRPNVPLTQPLHSKFPVSRRNAPSHQRSNFHPTEDNDDEDAYDSRGHPVQRHPYSLGGPPRRQSSGTQPSLWRPVPRAPEPSSISRTTTFSNANGQKYNTGPVQFPRRGSVNSSGSTRSGAGLRRAGSQNSGQSRTSSMAPHSGAERPLMQNRDRIASNIAHRERQTSASASPHERPSPSSHPTVSRAIPGARLPPLDDPVRFPSSASPGPRTLYSLQRSSEDMRPGIAIPRGPTIPEDGPLGTSWSSPNSRRSSGDFDLHLRHNSKGDRPPPVDGDLSDASDDVVGQLDVRRSMHSFCDVRSVRSLQSVDLEQRALWIEAEAKRMEEEASKKEDEARRLEEKARRSLEEVNRLEAAARQAEASAKMREAAAKNKETEAKRKEAEVKKREVESQKREAEAQRKEEQVRQMEREARRKEEQARRKEEEAQRKEDEARKREEEVRRKEDDARKRDDDARRREEDARQREMVARQKGEEVRRFEEEMERKEAELKKREAELLSKEQAARLQADGSTAEAQEAAKADPVKAQRKEEQARQMEHEARRKEEQARRKEEEAQRKEDEVRKREEEVRRKEDDARKRDDDARRREEDARQREMVARQKEEDVRRFEEEARRKEDEARRRREEVRQIEEDYERKKWEMERKEAELKKREAEFLRKEQAARLQTDGPTVEAQEGAKADVARQPEAECTTPESETQTKAQGRKGSKSQAKRQKEKDRELEERRQKEQEEQRQLEEQQRLEEHRRREEMLQREREEQIRLDEELSRQEQERLDREVTLEEERLRVEAEEREVNRLREEQQRAAEEERYMLLEEQRRSKAAEQSRQRDELRQQQYHQQEGILRQRAREEQQKEFERRAAQYHKRTLERERQNSMGASAQHRPSSTIGSAGDRSSASSTPTFSSSAGSTWSSRPAPMSSSHATNSFSTSSFIPLSSTPRPSPTSAGSGAPGTSPHASKLDEEWVRRAEEHVRQQQERFKREQERLESERQAKSAKVLSKDELVRLYEHHDNKWRQLRDCDNLRWNSFAWPVFKRPSEPEDMTTVAISAYVLSKYAPDASTKSPKDRVKDHLKRWHPDKFETRILPRVVEEEREKVKIGAGVVLRGLNELLNRNYED